MSVTDMPIIILAAGASRRMQGRDKLLERIDGRALLTLQAQKALAVTSGAILIALPVSPHPRYEALAGLAVQTVPVPDAAEGMNASLRRAFAALPRTAKAAMLVLADLPDLTADDLGKVTEAVDLTSNMLIWRGATAQGKPGHPIVFKAELFDAFADLRGDSGGRDVVARAKDQVQLVPLEGARATRDLDTPQEWARWRAEKSP